MGASGSRGSRTGRGGGECDIEVPTFRGGRKKGREGFSNCNADLIGQSTKEDEGLFEVRGDQGRSGRKKISYSHRRYSLGNGNLRINTNCSVKGGKQIGKGRRRKSKDEDSVVGGWQEDFYLTSVEKGCSKRQ